MSAVHDAFPIRRCSDRLSLRRTLSPCALAGMGRCLSPCDHSISPADYAQVVEGVRVALSGDIGSVIAAARERMTRLVASERFEEAAELRARLEAWTTASIRHHRIAGLARCPQLVAAALSDGGWEIHVVRHGRLAAAALARPGEIPQEVARQAVAVAETVPAPAAPAPAATIEEAERIAAWLERPGVRLIDIDGDWSWPLHAGLADGDLARILLG